MYVYNNILVNEKFCCYLRVFGWWKVAIIKLHVSYIIDEGKFEREEHNQWYLTMTNRQYNFFFLLLKQPLI